MTTPQRTAQRFPAEQARAFADAVVAIAMTLLILPLMESAADVSRATSVPVWLEEHGSQLFSFVLSFGIIAMFWVNHHRTFQRVRQVDGGLLWCTMAWLLGIVWLPVATALSGHLEADDPAVKAVYIGSMTLVALLSLLQLLWLRAHPVLHEMDPATMNGTLAMATAMLVLFTLSLVVAVAFPGLSYFPLFLMVGVGPLGRLFKRIIGPGRPTAPVPE